MNKPWWEKKPTDPKPVLVPEESTYRGYPVLSIPIDEDGTPMTFGLAKARALLRWHQKIQDFVDRHE